VPARGDPLHDGRYADKIAKDTKLRHDHGSQFISHAFQDELKTLGIESSPSFVRQPEGNGCPVFQDWAIHPDSEGAAALAAPIPHRRGAQPGAPRLRPQRTDASSSGRRREYRLQLVSETVQRTTEKAAVASARRRTARNS
jgi:hypothetical protein